MIDLSLFPDEPGVYLMKDAKGAVIYVGKAKHLKHRIKQYFAAHPDKRAMVPFLTAQATHIDTIIVPNEKEALILENTLIKKHKPKFNVLLKDDKTFISLMINHKHPWPMIRLVRYKKAPAGGALYFGPYTNAHAARETLELLSRIFPLRQCSDEELKRRTRPCLLYGIKRCIAPCVGKCSREEYQLFVEGAVAFLRGQNKEILRQLHTEMTAASEKLEFEKAGALLRTIKQIEHILQPSSLLVNVNIKDCDVIGLYRQAEELVLTQLLYRDGRMIGLEYYTFSQIAQEDPSLLASFLLQQYKYPHELPSEILLPIPIPNAHELEEILWETTHKKVRLLCPHHGKKKELLEVAYTNAKSLFHRDKNQSQIQEKRLLELQDTLKLTRYPERIECFDISTISGSDTVASLVAFTHGQKDKKRMRLFKIKQAHQGDDYAALEEALTRRLKRAKEEEDFPDLLIVDGGKGQLGRAIKVLEALNIASIDLIGIAKQEARHDKGLSQEQIFIPNHPEPLLLGPRSPLLFFLQEIRDETHRTALRFHQKRRTKRVLKTALDDIPGIGPVKRQRLLSHFGSVKRIRAASDEELLAVPGITTKDIVALRK